MNIYIKFLIGEIVLNIEICFFSFFIWFCFMEQYESVWKSKTNVRIFIKIKDYKRWLSHLLFCAFACYVYGTMLLSFSMLINILTDYIDIFFLNSGLAINILLVFCALLTKKLYEKLVPTFHITFLSTMHKKQVIYLSQGHYLGKKCQYSQLIYL